MLAELATGELRDAGHARSTFRESWIMYPGPPTSRESRLRERPPAWVVERSLKTPTHSTAHGFPFPCLVEHTTWSSNSFWMTYSSTALTPGGTGIALPTRPLALPFTLNTLFYAALLLGSTELVSTARRRHCARRNRCEHCNYDRAGLAPAAPCPECGR